MVTVSVTGLYETLVARSITARGSRARRGGGRCGGRPRPSLRFSPKRRNSAPCCYFSWNVRYGHRDASAITTPGGLREVRMSRSATPRLPTVGTRGAAPALALISAARDGRPEDARRTFSDGRVPRRVAPPSGLTSRCLERLRCSSAPRRSFTPSRQPIFHDSFYIVRRSSTRKTSSPPEIVAGEPIFPIADSHP